MRASGERERVERGPAWLSTLPRTLETGSFNGTAEEDTLYLFVSQMRMRSFSFAVLSTHVGYIFH